MGIYLFFVPFGDFPKSGYPYIDHPFLIGDFPWNKPSSYWVIPHDYGNHHFLYHLISSHTSVYLFAYHISIDGGLYIYIHIYLSIYLSIYIYIFMYMYIYVYIYTVYIYIINPFAHQIHWSFRGRDSLQKRTASRRSSWRPPPSTRRSSGVRIPFWGGPQ